MNSEEIINFIASIKRFPPLEIWKSADNNNFQVRCSPSFEDIEGEGVTLYEALVNLIGKLEFYLEKKEIDDFHRLLRKT